MINNKCCFLLILRYYPDLIIIEEGIYKGEELMSWSCIHQLIDPRQRIAVLGIDFIQVGEVDAHTPLFIYLLDQDNVHQPVWIHYFSNKASLDQLVHLLGYSLLALRGETSLLLFQWTISWVHFQVMGHHLRIYTKHVCRQRGKEIRIFLQKND